VRLTREPREHLRDWSFAIPKVDTPNAAFRSVVLIGSSLSKFLPSDGQTGS